MTKDKGVTLVALVVTIIVLLILAAVTINGVAGQNGILRKANEAKMATVISQEKQDIDSALIAVKAGKGEDTIKELTKDDLQQKLDFQLGTGKTIVSEKQENGDFIVTIVSTKNKYKINDISGAEKIEE